MPNDPTIQDVLDTMRDGFEHITEEMTKKFAESEHRMKDFFEARIALTRSSQDVGVIAG